MTKREYNWRAAKAGGEKKHAKKDKGVWVRPSPGSPLLGRVHVRFGFVSDLELSQADEQK